MPSFVDALTAQQVDAVIEYLRSQCDDKRWARGELNLPRPLRTEKAFPESETVLTVGATTDHGPDWDSELAYERRLGVRDQIELAIPFSSIQFTDSERASGVGDVALGLKHVFLTSPNTIISGFGEIVFPTGNSDRDLGSGTTTFGFFGAIAQLLPGESFVQAQIGTDQPASSEKSPRTFYWRVAGGRTWRQENGLGRQWSPMLEVVSERDFEDAARTNIDLVPQFQVSLNRRQHVRVNVGLQLPATHTTGRSKQVVFYLMWDWFDGGFREGWK